MTDLSRKQQWVKASMAAGQPTMPFFKSVNYKLEKPLYSSRPPLLESSNDDDTHTMMSSAGGRRPLRTWDSIGDILDIAERVVAEAGASGNMSTNGHAQDHRRAWDDSIGSVLDITEEVLEEIDTVDGFAPGSDNTPVLEPTPIALDKVRFVDTLHLTDADSLFFASKEERHAMAGILFPLIRKRQHDQRAGDDLFKSPRSSFLKNESCEDPTKKKKQRLLSQRCYQSASSTAIDMQVLSAMDLKDEVPPFPSSSSEGGLHFRSYQTDVWCEKLEQLREFKAQHGHCLIPHNWDENIPLAQWVKRQRYQYKLKYEGRHSTLTDEREKILEDLGFVWDSHRAAWEERLNEIRAFQDTHAHCNVPSSYPENPQLSVWVKGQRRQYKLFMRGERSNINGERIDKLSDMGFEWDPRKLL